MVYFIVGKDYVVRKTLSRAHDLLCHRHDILCCAHELLCRAHEIYCQMNEILCRVDKITHTSPPQKINCVSEIYHRTQIQIG